ncbi:MAG: hypothetical protein IPM57_00530 [Oligoflexia bacterium]|nr:hypothetical protein [Oligoflexia bacterium]
MIEKLKAYLSNEKHKIIVITVLSFLVLLMMWVFKKDGPAMQAKQEEVEFGAVIPKGYLLVPVDLKNSKSLSVMVVKHAVIDLFLNNQILARNLKIIKLNPQEQEANFAALVPDKIATRTQSILASKNLTGALKSHLNTKLEFFIPKVKSSLVTTYVTEENL